MSTAELVLASSCVVGVLIVAVLLLVDWSWRRPPADPGPWRLDRRLPRHDGRCRWRSEETNRRCVHRVRHRRRHDVPDSEPRPGERPPTRPAA